jgi:hypothetical protein
MRLILDANEYIFGLNRLSGKSGSIRLIHEILPRLMDEVENFSLLVPETVRDEVQRSIARSLLSDFYRLVTSDPKILYGWLYEVPPELLNKYVAKGLKPADATIAAFADWFEADFLISDNRHIYEQLKVDEFVTCTAAEFVDLVDSGEIGESDLRGE